MNRALVLLLLPLAMRFNPAGLVLPEKYPLAKLTAGELALVSGIGPVLAGRLVEQGGSGLENVKGIGKKKADILHLYISTP